MKTSFAWVWVLVSLLATGCANQPDSQIVPPSDGGVALPSDFEDWPVFIDGIEKNSRHIRDIYISEEGAAVEKAQPFPLGTRFVMTIYDAVEDEEGRTVRGELSEVYLMAKGKGYGQNAKINNGSWIYAAYGGNGQPLEKDMNSCRACHAPLADKDFVFHYDQFFEQK